MESEEPGVEGTLQVFRSQCLGGTASQWALCLVQGSEDE